MLATKKLQLAELLLSKNIITTEQMQQALEKQKKSGKKLGQIFVELGYVDRYTLLTLLSQQLNIPFVDVKNATLDTELIKHLPEFYARHYRALILDQDDTHYTLGMIDPQDLIAVDAIQRVLDKPIKFALIDEEDLLFVLDTLYRRTDEISKFAETLSEDIQTATGTQLFSDTSDFTSEDLPVVNLLRSVFEDAVQVNASDIHIEPGENILRIRIRVDGVLQEQIVKENQVAQAIVQRIKLMSNLNIAEKRLPQDGRFSTVIKDKTFDVRVSTLPTQYGESLVMRLLNQSASLLQLSTIGMPEKMLQQHERILTASYGLYLIVGPTGSGKTTTLYASLNELNKPEDKIITVEDPIEYRLPRINQVQVNAKINLTFASVLRSILRQDPDIIMIGELRDQETMEIAMRAAMTGHFVLATLHTNDTVSTVTRMLDMGAEGYLLASVLRGILAQRLVRKICTQCMIDDPLTANEKAWLLTLKEVDFSHSTFKRGQGCRHCHQTGYQGRIGVFELLPLTAETANALAEENLPLFLKDAQQHPIYRSLLHSALDLAKEHATTIEEVLRMAGEI